MSARTKRETVTEGKGGREGEREKEVLKQCWILLFQILGPKPTEFSYAVDDVT